MSPFYLRNKLRHQEIKRRIKFPRQEVNARATRSQSVWNRGGKLQTPFAIRQGWITGDITLIKGWQFDLKNNRYCLNPPVRQLSNASWSRRSRHI